jgi:flagellar biosynthesis protein FlhB
MPGEKTEQPTQKRLNDSRKKGEVFKSKDFVQALLFMVAAAVLTAGGPAYVSELRDLMKESFTPAVMQGTMPANAILSRMGYA